MKNGNRIMSNKFCVDCKWYEERDDYRACGRPRLYNDEVNRVTGEEEPAFKNAFFTDGALLCTEERYYFKYSPQEAPEDYALCGASGLFFEEKVCAMRSNEINA